MSYSPPDLSHHHTRQPSLPTVYENNDPYRVTRKSPTIGNTSDSNSDFDAVHSRTASDSSTTRLLHTLPTIDFHDDPYASKKKWRSIQEENRANSYLPYSHHVRDPNQRNEPIYIEEYAAPASTTLGMGSMLHDNMTDQINKGALLPTDTTNRIQDANLFTDKMSSEMKKKKRKNKRCCGLRYRTIALITILFLAIVAVIIYFVWPRVPKMSLMDVDNIGTVQIPKNATKKSYATTWQLNMTVDNSQNWLTTRIKSIDFELTDNDTNNRFGNGTIGHRNFPPRQESNLIVPMTINSGEDETIFQNLYDACGVQVSSTMPFDVKQDTLNVTLHITYHIAGIVWPSTQSLPVHDLRCPTS